MAHISPSALTNGVTMPPNGTTTTTHKDEPSPSPSPPAPAQSTPNSSKQARSSSPSSLATVAADLHARVTSFLAEHHPPASLLHRVQNQTRISLAVTREALARYSIRELSLSYNGGKDCLVLLVLFLACLHPHLSSGGSGSGSSKTEDSNNNNNNNNNNTDEPSPSASNSKQTDNTTTERPPTTIPAIYARPSHPFPSVESFVTSSSAHYHLSLTQYTCNSPPQHTSIRSVFASYLAAHPHVRAIFVGTRRTDPHGEKLTHFDRTDGGWPDFMRVHPVIDWHYVEIWGFIRHLGIEYCPLYDEGYTSLGGTDDTYPNPKLRADGDGDGNAYRPAYELIDDDEERLGRN